MLVPASIADVAKLAKVKEGFGESAVRSRFEWLSTVQVTWTVWWADHTPCGWVLIQWNGKPTAPDYPDLNDLYVHPAWRNLGIGTKIILACEHKLREMGYTKIGLAVNPDLNPRAHVLYQRLGYVATQQAKYLDGVYDGVEDWVINLEKQL